MDPYNSEAFSASTNLTVVMCKHQKECNPFASESLHVSKVPDTTIIKKRNAFSFSSGEIRNHRAGRFRNCDFVYSKALVYPAAKKVTCILHTKMCDDYSSRKSVHTYTHMIRMILDQSHETVGKVANWQTKQGRCLLVSLSFTVIFDVVSSIFMWILPRTWFVMWKHLQGEEAHTPGGPYQPRKWIN